ncbi:uncharacterized protein [Dysidea avara]|uniref:uncharacterized protein n=1 Tax=Dysidea avara TaxID=196820 RepID=UPI00331FC2B9
MAGPKQLIILISLGAIIRSCTAQCGLLDKCEPVVVGECKKLYNATIFPNKVCDFDTQANAMKQFGTFERLIYTKCSPLLSTFLCSYYFPPCPSDGKCLSVGPCEDLCEQVRADCEPVMKLHNHEWPNFLTCNKFPKSNGPDVCIPASAVVPMPPPTTLQTPCERVNHSVCASLSGDYMTRFPNKNMITQDEANLQFSTFKGALDSNCSSMLRPFLCLSHFPACSAGNTDHDIQTVYPCRHMCKQVRRSCEPFLIEHNGTWPDFLNCSHFPNKTNEVCLDSTDLITTPSKSPEPPTTETNAVVLPNPEHTCEPILPEVLEVCGDIHGNYTTTHFPHGDYVTQRDAVKVFNTFVQHMKTNCAPEIKPFLCYHFFPFCSPLWPTELVKPCRSVCRKARTGCEPCVNKHKHVWPDFLDCNNFKVKGTCLSLNNLKDYTRSFSGGSTC